MMTTKELSERAFAMGYQTAERGGSRAPALNEEFMDMMRSNQGVDWTAPLQAFVRGYQAKIDAGNAGS